jgi:alkylated DNA nucleotide flippase Atl1
VTRHEHDALQRILLEQEGIKFTEDGIIDLKKYLWIPELVNK